MTKHDVKLGRTCVPVPQDCSPIPLGGSAKRRLDICGAAIGIVVLSPLFLMICLLVKFMDGGPIFHGHRRVGFQGRTFLCWTFRTVTVHGEEVRSAFLAVEPEETAEWAARRRLRAKARATDAGAVLSRLGIDKLPQLFNVLRGDMSLVGPHPVGWREMEHYESAVIYYLSARPGLIGAWQAGGSGDAICRERVSSERHYVENWSVLRDLSIILKTIPADRAARGSC